MSATDAYLLDGGNMSRDIFDGDWILDCQAVALALYPCLVDQDASIGRET